MSNFEKLEKIIGYKFNNKTLLSNALTHISYAHENNVDSYERLEFLGDAIIELVVSEYIYDNLQVDVGVLTKLRASLVSTDNLFNISNILKLSTFASIGKSLQSLSKKNTADLFESLLGAIYLDGGMAEAKKLIDRYVIVNNENIQNHIRCCVDYKTKLQEYLQSVGKSFRYEVLSSRGLDHEKVFEVGLFVNDELVTSGSGKSIQKAEAICAEKYINSNNI